MEYNSVIECSACNKNSYVLRECICSNCGFSDEHRGAKSLYGTLMFCTVACFIFTIMCLGNIWQVLFDVEYDGLVDIKMTLACLILGVLGMFLIEMYHARITLTPYLIVALMVAFDVISIHFIYITGINIAIWVLILGSFIELIASFVALSRCGVYFYMRPSLRKKK